MADQDTNTTVAAAETSTAAPAKAKRAPAKKAVAKKATPAKAKGKKAAAKVETKSTLSPAMVAKFDDAFARWNKGEQICHLAAEIGCKRGALRRQLRKRSAVKVGDKVLKGREAFKALRNKGAGGVRASLGKRAKSPGLDKEAKVVSAEERKGWTRRWVDGPEGKVAVSIAKGGVEYVPAKSHQKADILCEMSNGLPPARLVLYATPSGKVKAE